MRAVITEIVSGFPPPASLNEIQSNSFAMNSTTRNCGAAALYACGAIGIRPRAPNHRWRPPFGRQKAYPPSRVRASCVRAYLTALLLAHDLFGDSLFDACCRLDGKPTRHFLRIFKHIDCAYLAPPQGDHVETWLKYEPPLSSVCSAVPLHKHGGMRRPALHPDIVDLEMEIGQDAADALKPVAQGFLVVALTTNRVGAGKAVMDIRRDCFSAAHPSDGC